MAQAVLGVVVVTAGLTWSWMWGAAVAWAVLAAVATFVAGQWDFARHRRSGERGTGS